VTARGPHGTAPQARSLDERLRAADAAALVQIDAARPGRFLVRQLGGIHGDLPPRFAIKRSPSRSPELRPGDRLVACLRGARSPYLLLDAAHELARLPDEEAGLRWLAAARALLEAEGDAARRELYDEWLAGADAGLREEAIRGLATDPAPPEDYLERLLASALASDDAGRRADLARALAASASGAGLLAGALLDAPETAPPELWDVALAAGAADPALRPAMPPLLARALAHPDPRPRRAALRFALAWARDPRLAGPLARAAEEDPDEQVRRRAARLLGAGAAPEPAP